MWRNGRLAVQDGVTVGSDTPINFTVYLGTADQLPDPTMEADKGVGMVPAHRGWAYVVFADLNASEDGNMMANWEFEVVAGGSTEPFGLRRYSTFALDPGVFDPVPPAYSYPYLLNGQELLSDGKTLRSHQFQASNAYGPDDHDGAWSYVSYDRDLKGRLISTNAGGTLPFPQFGHPTDIFAFNIHGSMNSNWAHAAGQMTEVWPDGSEVPKTHYVDAWLQKRSVVKHWEELLLAAYPDSEAPVPYVYAFGTNVRHNKFIYATCGGFDDPPEGSTDPAIKRFPIIAGRPKLVADAAYYFEYAAPYSATPCTGYAVVIGDDGFIYVLGTRNGVNCRQLYKFDADLNLIKQWDSPDGPYPGDKPTILFDFSPYLGAQPAPGYSSFVIYHGYIVIDTTVGFGTPAAACFKLNDDDTTTLVNYVEMEHPSPLIYLGRGFVACRDGILNFGGAGSGGVTLGEIVADISDRCGLDDDELDVTEIPDPVPGFKITGGSGRANIEALIPAFVFGAVESDDVVKFRHLNRPSCMTIPDAELGAHARGETAPPLLALHRLQEVDLPRSITVKYANQGADYQVGVQRFRKQTTTSQLDAVLELPVVLTDTMAKNAANINGANAWMEQNQYQLAVSRKYAHLEPLDVITARGKTMRLVSNTESLDGVIKWDAVATAEAVLIDGEDGAGGGFVPVVPAYPQSTTLQLLDIPLPRDDSLANGVPSPMCGEQGSGWRGAELFKSADGGATYASTGVISRSADTIGTAKTVLGNFTGGNIFDELNEVTVEVVGTLAGATEAAVLNGANLGVLGNELLQWKVATLIESRAEYGINTYTLSGLLRGRRGTEWAIPMHEFDDVFVALPANANYPTPFGEVGLPRKFKAVTFGDSLAKADAIDFTNTGRALQPYSPVQLGGGVNASGDVTLNWTPRTRTGGQWRDVVDAQDSDPKPATWIVEIWNSAYTLCARIITVTSAQTTTYTAAQQTTDFGAMQHDIYFTAARLGSASLGVRARGVARGSGASNVDPSSPISPYGESP